MLQDAASKVFPLLLTYPLGLGSPFFWEGLYGDGDDSLQSQLVQKWKDELVTSSPSGQPLVNVTGWLSLTTLDIMRQGEINLPLGILLRP